MTQIATSYPVGIETEEIAESDNALIDNNLNSIEELRLKIKENSAVNHHTPKLTRFINSKHMSEISVLESEIDKIKHTKSTSANIEKSRKKARAVISLCENND